MPEYETINGEDILANSLRAVKHFIPKKRAEVQKFKPNCEKGSAQYQLNEAHKQGYLQALQDLEDYIKSIGA